MRRRDNEAEHRLNAAIAGLIIKWSATRANKRMVHAIMRQDVPFHESDWPSGERFREIQREELESILRELEDADPAVAAAVAEILSVAGV